MRAKNGVYFPEHHQMWYQNVYIISIVSGAIAAAVTYFLLSRRTKNLPVSAFYYDCIGSFLVTGLLVFLGIQLYSAGTPVDGADFVWREMPTGTESLSGGSGGGGGGGGGPAASAGVDDSLFQSFADNIQTGTPKF